MAKKYSPEAFALVNEVHDRIRPFAGQMVWKPVALALAEVLIKINDDFEGELSCEYGGTSRKLTSDMKEYLDIEVWKWIAEAKNG